MLSKLPWPDKVKVWEMHYLQRTPIDQIRWEVKGDKPAPSWETVKQVVSEFLSLSPSQVRILPDPLQARWKELKLEKDTGQQEISQVVRHVKEDMPETVVADRSAAHNLFQTWRSILEGFSPTRLLERELAEASENAVGEFFRDEGEKEANRRTHQRHSSEMMPQLKADPVYASLRQSFPDPTILTALDTSLDAWGQSVPTYISAYFDMMLQLDDWVRLLVSSMSDEQTTDNVNLSVYISERRKQTAYAVLIACDLLIHGLSELPANIHWTLLHNGLRKLRVRANRELSSLTDKTQKGGWPSNAALIWAERSDPSGLVNRTRVYLSELAKLHSAQESVETLLQKLESKL